jgi:hypothetical protein
VTPEESRILAVVGHALYLSCTGTPLAERMRAPRPGDLVLEVTEFGRGWDPDRIGRLVRVEGSPSDERYVIAPLHDAERQRVWRDSTFVALPIEPADGWLNADPMPVRTKYRPLTDYLRQDGRERIEMSFEDIESVMGGVHLPPSARNPRLAEWWANDSGHVQAQAWMAAGYQIEAVDISGQRVRFRTQSPPSR